MAVIRQHTPVSPEPPAHLLSQPMITRGKQHRLDDQFNDLFTEWYFLDLDAKRVLAGNIVETIIVDPSNWYKEHVRLLIARNVAEDDDPEDDTRAVRRTPNKSDPAWYPGSEARAARIAKQRQLARASSPSTPSRGTRQVEVVPSVEVINHDDDAGDEQDSPVPSVQRRLFTLPTPAATPAPAQTRDEHNSGVGEEVDSSLVGEQTNQLKARIDELHTHMEVTRQSLQAALSISDIDTSEAQAIQAKLQMVTKRLSALGDHYLDALYGDARLVSEAEGGMESVVDADE